MGNKNKSDADLPLDPLQFVLHLLAQLQIQGGQRLIQKEYLRLVYQSPGNGHTLLLPAGEQCSIFVLVSFQTDQFEHLHNLLVNDILAHLLDLQAKCDIFIDAQVRKQRILLKDRVQFPPVGRHIADLLPVKDHASFIRVEKSPQDTQKRSLAAAAGPQQRDKFIFINIQINSLEDDLSVKILYNISEFYQFFPFHLALLLRIQRSNHAYYTHLG